MKNMISLFFLITVIVFNFSCGTKKNIVNKTPKSVTFTLNSNKTLTDVLELAQLQNKLVFVDFYADWCLPCNILDEEVFNQREVYSIINKNFISYKVDIEKTNGANLKIIFNAEHLPTLLFLDTKGKVLKRKDNTTYQTELIEMVNEVLEM